MKDEGFRIETPEQAAWAMRKYRKLAQKYQKHGEMARKETARIESWLERVNEPVVSQMEFFESHLRAYAMMERSRGNKSLEFPDGTIKTRQSGASFDIDKTVFVEWAQEEKRDDVLRSTYAPNVSAIKATFIADGGKVIDPLSGEVVPGLLPVPETITTQFIPDMDALDLDDEDDDDATE